MSEHVTGALLEALKSLAGRIVRKDAWDLVVCCTGSVLIPRKQGHVGFVDCSFSGTFCLACGF